MPNATRSDAAGNLWVRTTSIVQCGVLYYVINRRGLVTDRVCVPTSRTIVGFGAGNAVYLFSREPGAVRLERASAR